jgi:predicted phosphodiesterase
VVAVRGNVDEQAAMDELPSHRLVTLNGWRVLIIHIAAAPPSAVSGSHDAHVMLCKMLTRPCI